MFTLMDLDWKLLKPIKVIFFIKAGALNNKCVVIKFFKTTFLYKIVLVLSLF